MDVKKVSEEVRLQQWMAIIKECRDSGEPVSVWCKNHGVSEASYYYYLKKIRTKACEMIPVETTSSFVPIAVTNESITKTNIVFRKGDISIEVSSDITEDLLTAIIRSLSC